MTIRLEHQGKVYGLLSVSIPRDFIAYEKEHSLFREIAGDTVNEFSSGKVCYAETVHPDDLERVIEEVLTYSKEKERKEFHLL